MKKEIQQLSPKQQLVLNLIPFHKALAITGGKLVRLTGIPLRELKEIITQLREDYPICAQETNGGGYWIATEEEDINEFIRLLIRRKNGFAETITKMQYHSARVM